MDEPIRHLKPAAHPRAKASRTVLNPGSRILKRFEADLKLPRGPRSPGSSETKPDAAGLKPLLPLERHDVSSGKVQDRQRAFNFRESSFRIARETSISEKVASGSRGRLQFPGKRPQNRPGSLKLRPGRAKTISGAHEAVGAPWQEGFTPPSTPLAPWEPSSRATSSWRGRA